MGSNRKALGQLGERLAAEYLTNKGYLIVERNWRSGRYEIDLVARDMDVYVVVEVRTRRGKNFGSPEDSITSEKRKRIRNAGMTYLFENRLEMCEWRIDLVAIELDLQGKVIRTDHYQNIVEGGV